MLFVCFVGDILTKILVASTYYIKKTSAEMAASKIYTKLFDDISLKNIRRGWGYFSFFSSEAS